MLIILLLKITLPVEGIKLTMAWARVVFPEPDSPTIPKVVPLFRQIDISVSYTHLTLPTSDLV